ncbi:para-aminobenzoic acid synthetase [Cylindrobasidium torrendii FP15055 ss-10]|uniref:aminodeoxychorismate synthase n=1 Tax=Cylindrobasidium torrendii FP15055 ss-10 TaxID=1314674 RepID=A0A0D7BAH0_9AGAR|nr:para-aminobenzoic acid synthetase [Cylindrobasidium torrendii FP15055 ss-10]
MTLDAPRVLLIDSYDSFTFNLAALVKRAIPSCLIHIVKNDELDIGQLRPLLKYFAAIIVGPGPGSPELAKDVGVLPDLWKLPDADVLPIFGVCLGLQSLALAFYGSIHRLPIVKHGQISEVHHDGTSLFSGVGAVEAVRYHSLHAILPANGPLQPLAWAHDKEQNGNILMAVAHDYLPFSAVQYHPESVRTNGGGIEVLANFWDAATIWSKKRGRYQVPWTNIARDSFTSPWPAFDSSIPHTTPKTRGAYVVRTRTLHLPSVSIEAICEMLGAQDDDLPFAALDSAAHPGRFSVVGCPTPSSPQFTHFVGEDCVYVTRSKTRSQQNLHGKDVWAWLSTFMADKKAEGGIETVPFWAGLLGMLSYEIGLGRLGVTPLSARIASRKHPHPDVNLIFVERSIVVDHLTGTVYVQSIVPNDDSWLQDTEMSLVQLSSWPSTCGLAMPAGAATHVELPDKSHYISGIRQCMDYLASGDSYELCYTAHTRVHTPPVSSWSRYKALRASNPAPHGAFVRLAPTTFCSSSPERFLSYSRPPQSLCQLRPIKGTVRKGPGMDRAAAEQALAHNPKEVAENLMIVDLIRHDLHSVLGQDVEVKKFCGIEEYKTVWQMTSVIEGRPVGGNEDDQLGWKVLQATLPPGSMTGAPKKRSVELLQQLENTDRSMYSGVFGYWCVGGSGDWAVTIRSCFKHDAESTPDSEDWVIGAGGAITALSDPESEWDEMLLKLGSVLRIFQH